MNTDDGTWRKDFAAHFKLRAAVLFDRNNPATSESSAAAVKELLSNPRMGALIEYYQLPKCTANATRPRRSTPSWTTLRR